MGIISFALQGNYKRFYNDLKALSKTTHKPAWYMFLDTAVCTLRYGSGLQDYLNFRFYEKRHAERKTYVSVGYLDNVITKLPTRRIFIRITENLPAGISLTRMEDTRLLRRFWTATRCLSISRRSVNAARMLPSL